jgi:predicted AAA+ superfamily ATPase
MERYLKKHLFSDLKKKMVFVSGPRQCGKTTLVKDVGSLYEHSTYLNYDSARDKKIILRQEWDTDSRLVIFDEIHKYARWKNFVKGTYDTQKDKRQFIVTGSARLDIYKRGQDSLLGRYHGWRLHPFCLAENPLTLKENKALERFLERGGFPEPFLETSTVAAQRWKNEHLKLILKEDVRDLTRVRETSLLDLFLTGLRERVGSPIVISNIANDVEVAPKTGKLWLTILEQLYICIVVKPYAKGIDRGLIVPPKVYFYNNTEVEGDIGAKFENLVATHLLKRAHFLEDSTGVPYELRYIRDKEKREVDFLVLKNRKPSVLIECKWSDTNISSSLRYFEKKLPGVKAIQLVGDFNGNVKKDGVQVLSAHRYLSRNLAEEF